MNHREALAALTRSQTWRKSSHSERANDCVEITTDLPGWVGVRDSKLSHDSPILAFTRQEWQALVQGIRDGELDANTDSRGDAERS